MSKIIGVTVGTPLSPSLIKEKIKPVTSVNGVEADENGNVEVKTPSSGAGLPPVSATDNGKVLGVVNGAYALVTPKYPVVTQNGSVLTIE